MCVGERGRRRVGSWRTYRTLRYSLLVADSHNRLAVVLDLVDTVEEGLEQPGELVVLALEVCHTKVRKPNKVVPISLSL